MTGAWSGMGWDGLENRRKASMTTTDYVMAPTTTQIQCVLYPDRIAASLRRRSLKRQRTNKPRASRRGRVNSGLGPAQVDPHWPPSPGSAIKTHLAVVVSRWCACPPSRESRERHEAERKLQIAEAIGGWFTDVCIGEVADRVIKETEETLTNGQKTEVLLLPAKRSLDITPLPQFLEDVLHSCLGEPVSQIDW